MSDIIPHTSKSLSSPRSFTGERDVSVEGIILAWLHSKKSHSQSEKTQVAYETTIYAFRGLLQENGYDLIWKEGDSVPSDFVPMIADFAQAFASLRSINSRRKGPVASATQSQRLAIISSFYGYAIKRRHLLTSNPIDCVDRPSVDPYEQALAIEQEEIEARLRSIDKTTLQGARDLALLVVLLSTGRRVSEVASLYREHLSISGNLLTLSFEHCKGAKKMRDTLSLNVSRELRTWLTMFYQTSIEDIPLDAPLWVNLHHKSRKGESLGYYGVSGICQHYLGTSKVHTTRHTFAILMEMAGAKLTDIQQRLGHKNAATTGTYMNKLNQHKNIYAEKLSAFLGLE